MTRSATSRIGAFGATAVLSIGSLLAVPAQAYAAPSPVDATYDCGVTSLVTSTSADLTGITASGPLQPGAKEPKGAIPTSVGLRLTSGAVVNLRQSGYTDVIVTTKYALRLGSTSIPIGGVNAARTALPASGGLNFPASTMTSGAFTLPYASGTIPVQTPTSFPATFRLRKGRATSVFPTTCNLVGSQSTFASLTIAQQTSSIDANLAHYGGGGTVYENLIPLSLLLRCSSTCKPLSGTLTVYNGDRSSILATSDLSTAKRHAKNLLILVDVHGSFTWDSWVPLNIDYSGDPATAPSTTFMNVYMN